MEFTSAEFFAKTVVPAGAGHTTVMTIPFTTVFGLSTMAQSAACRFEALNDQNGQVIVDAMYNPPGLNFNNGNPLAGTIFSASAFNGAGDYEVNVTQQASAANVQIRVAVRLFV